MRAKSRVDLMLLVVACAVLSPMVAGARPPVGKLPPAGGGSSAAPTPRPTPPPKPPAKPKAKHSAPGKAVDPSLPQPCRTHDECGPADLDRDGIRDAWEDTLALRYAPELRLPPARKDRMRPASVDWYLARVAMRFENKGTCNRDVQVLKVGEVTQANLARQSRRDKVMTISGCRSRGRRRSSNSSRRFFLQPKDDAVHKGAPPSQWRTYVHVKRSSDAPGGYDLQYWFFYPFNDSAASLNHEGDWEHITVTTDAAGSFVEAYYSQHEGGEVYSAEELQRTHGDHPVVYVADGSHASYNKRGKFDIPGVPRFDDRTYDGGPVWRTWSTLVFVGEKEFPRNKQNFLHFGGRWGEIGLKKTTSGPTGPAFKERWNTR